MCLRNRGAAQFFVRPAAQRGWGCGAKGLRLRSLAPGFPVLIPCGGTSLLSLLTSVAGAALGLVPFAAGPIKNFELPQTGDYTPSL